MFLRHSIFYFVAAF